jgi:hypothetical protein
VINDELTVTGGSEEVNMGLVNLTGQGAALMKWTSDIPSGGPNAVLFCKYTITVDACYYDTAGKMTMYHISRPSI